MSIIDKFKKSDEKEETEILENEILSIVSEGKENGFFKENEAIMISNIFALDDKTAKDIATYRGQMVVLDFSMSLHEALNEMLENSFSRYPVIDGDLDHIVGILHLKDVVKAIRSNKDSNVSLRDKKSIIRKAKFVPEARPLNNVFADMQMSKTQMVIVIDEYGQTTGLLAMEDILEEIVGNIQDEYDNEVNHIIKNARRGIYIISGMTTLEELEKTLNINFGDSNFDTINGFITDKIGHIPNEKEEFSYEFEGYIFKVIEVKEKCIKTLHVVPVASVVDSFSEK